MNYKTFKKKTVQEIEKLLPPGRQIRLDTVSKLNGNELEAIMLTDDTLEPCPTLYFRDLYDMYCAGMPFDEIIRMAMSSFEVRCQSAIRDISEINYYEKIADRLCCRLINTERNEQLLNEIPSLPFHDLSVVFYLSYEDNGEHAIITVNNSLMEQWDKSPEDIIDIARSNTMRLNGVTLFSLNDLMEEFSAEMEELEDDLMTEEDLIRTDPETGERLNNDVLVITGRYRSNGAIHMLDSGLLDAMCDDFDDDVILIPSSIHEVLAAPAESVEFNRINEFIKVANCTTVKPQEVLSDHAYIYSRAMHRII